MAPKEGTHLHENNTPSPWPEAPREAASRARFSNKEQQFELKMLFKLVSIAFVPTICSKLLFELAPIANVPTSCSNKMKRINVKSTLLMI